MAEGAGRARRMWASASSAPRRRGRHLLLGLASPLLPCSRWPPPPSPTTRRAGSGGGDVQELRSSRQRGRCPGASTWPRRCPGDSIRQGQQPRAQDPAPTPTPRSGHSNVQKRIYLLHLSEPFERPIHDVQIWSWDASQERLKNQEISGKQQSQEIEELISGE